MEFFKRIDIDTPAVVISSLVGVVCLYLLFINPIEFDPFPKKITEKTPAGEVKIKSNRLVRKSSGEFSWKELIEKQVIYFNDRLFTNDNSSANILLDEGDEIVMGPNTLIEVAKKEDSQEISFFKGKARLKVSGKSTSTLKIGNKKYQLKGRNSELEISKSKTKETTIDVVKGNASLVSKTGETIDITEGSRLEIKKTKTKVKKNFLKTSLLAPFDGREFEFHQNIDISLNWKFYGKATPYELEIATDSSFRNIIKRAKDPAAPFSTNLSKSGKYYWRIKTKDQPNPKYSTFVTYALKPVNLLFPKNNDYTQILFEENHALIDLVWNTNKNKKYELQVKNLDTNEIILNKKTRRTRHQMRFKPGSYAWKVITYGQKIKGPSSKIFKLIVEKEKDPFVDLAKIKIENKKSKETLMGTKLFAPSPKTALKFTWPTQDVKRKIDLRYQVILKNEDGDELLNFQTKNNYFLKDNWRRPGSYQLIVRPTLGKFKGKYSEVYEFDLIHPKPPLPPIIPRSFNFHKLRADRFPNAEEKDEEQKNTIFWSSTNPEYTYYVQISEDDDFDIIIDEFEINSPKFKWPINQEGEYYFRVATINAWGVRGEFSDESKVIIEPPLPTKQELALIARQKREAEEAKRLEELRQKKEKEKQQLLKILEEKRKIAAEKLKKSIQKGVKKVLSWFEFIPKSVLVSLGTSYYQYGQESTTVTATADAAMVNFGTRVNFDVLDTYVGQINYMQKQSVTSTGLDFTDYGLGLIAGKHVRLSDKFDLKPTAGIKLSGLTFFKLNGTQVEAFNEFFTSFNATLMLSYLYSPTIFHDFGVYADIGDFNQFGAEYQFIYRPKGSKWLFDISTLYLMGEATATDSVNEKVVTKNELQFSFQIGREFK